MSITSGENCVARAQRGSDSHNFYLLSFVYHRPGLVLFECCFQPAFKVQLNSEASLCLHHLNLRLTSLFAPDLRLPFSVFLRDHNNISEISKTLKL